MNLSFNLVDLLVVLVLLTSAGYAAWRGFVSETLSIIAWAAAAFATLYFGPWVVPLARGMIATPWLGSLAAYAGVFLVVLIPLAFMSHRFSEGIKRSALGPLDRALGIAFGVVRGLLVVGVAYLLFTYLVPISKQPQAVTQARLLPLVQSSSEVILSLVPSRDQTDFTGEAEKDQSRNAGKVDRLGQLIRNQDAQPAPEPAKKAPKTAEKSAQKTYGAKDRRALDTLLKDGKP
jgi:membrane protein required for colicin V production